MGASSSKETKVSAEESYTEDEFLEEFGRSYDFFHEEEEEEDESDATSTDSDSDVDNEFYLCLNDWYFCTYEDNNNNNKKKNKKPIKVDLPSLQENMVLNYDSPLYLEGYVTAPGKSRVFIRRIAHLSAVVVDRTRSVRGFWVMRQDTTAAGKPIYWLQQPDTSFYSDQQLLPYRGGLAAISNLIDWVFDQENGSDFCHQTIQQVSKQLTHAFDKDLVAQHRDFVVHYLASVIPELTQASVFLKSVASLRVSNKRWSAAELLQKIQQAEQRSHQLPWGEPLGELPDKVEDMVVAAVKSPPVKTPPVKSARLSSSKPAARTSRTLKPVSKAKDVDSEDDYSEDDYVAEPEHKTTAQRRSPRKRELSPAHQPLLEKSTARNTGGTMTTSFSSRPSRAAKVAANKKMRVDLSDDEDAMWDESSSDTDMDDNVLLGITTAGKLTPRNQRAAAASRSPKNQASNGKSNNSKTAVAKTNGKQPKKKKSKSSDESAEDDAFSPSDGDQESDDESEDLLDAMSESDSDVPPPKATKRSKAKVKEKGPTTKVAKAKAVVTTKGNNDVPVEAKNVPVYKDLSLDEIAAKKEFLDPCGMEATDDIIDRLIGEQVDKLGGLFVRALKDTSNIGSMARPLKLGTACSGTDAPSLAMSLVKEQLELRNMGDLFMFKHGFSCEKEPFKQAYLARNFDSILYPDITKMTEDNPRDVYGQVQPVPEMNLFVAGTSCKNFSMLRTKWRIDIEDRGCSGETFLAAVEILYKEKPYMSIFENVKNAPWEKMSDYITGRVKLHEIEKRKNISDDKDKGEKLTFVLGSKNTIVVDKVPGVYGVRCGAVVRGFVHGESDKVIPARWPEKCKEKCTLEDLMKENKISKERDTLVFVTECTFCKKLAKVDTKRYGLPQTRERTYMFVWRPENKDIHDDLGIYWEQIVKFLESPTRYSLAAFMLEDDHPDVRRYREALNGPPGRQSKKEAFQQPDFFESNSGNVKYNLATRKANGIQRDARFYTNWKAYGQKQVPPQAWLPWVNCNTSRIVDMLDILYASSIRDAESHDPLFASFLWNVSQNADRESHRSATPGIAGCLTPGGDFFVPHRGRPLLGCERLLTQGIPYFRLMLGNETNVQLGDMAGNAMSLTVVCATMLAAMTCQTLRRETVCGKLTSDAILTRSSRSSSKWDPCFLETRDATLSKAYSMLRQLAEVAKEAVQSSVWCICETSGNNSDTASFVQCKHCRISCCRNCISDYAGPNLKYHDAMDVHITQHDHDPGAFQGKLREIAVTSLSFTKDGLADIAGVENDIHRVTALSGIVFNLHRVKRDRRKWVLLYYARDNNGIGEAAAELRITVGELRTQALDPDRSVETGAMAEFTSFVPARTEPFVYGNLEPCARCTLLTSNLSASEAWCVKDNSRRALVLIEGKGSKTDSLKAEVGLLGEVADDLRYTSLKSHNKKHFDKAKQRGEEHRWLYPSNWQHWPEIISIKSIAGEDFGLTGHVVGLYRRARCRQTTNQSALWIREGQPGENRLYIVIQPNFNRTGPDVAVITFSINHADISDIVAYLPRGWQPCDSLQGPKKQALQLTCWRPSSTMNMMSVSSNVKVKSPKAPDDLIQITGLSATQLNMLSRGEDLTSGVMKLHVHTGQQAQQIIRAFNSICVSPILTLVAQSGLKYSISPDAPFTELKIERVGHNESVVPPRPMEEWIENTERGSMERTSKPGAARDYFLHLQKARHPFEFHLDVGSRSLTVKCYPDVAAHHAAANLVRGRHIDSTVSVAFKLSDASQQRDPLPVPFVVHNCDSEVCTNVPLRKPHALYPRQQKVVTKMLAIEERRTTFGEVELSEFDMPGSTGFSLIARASRSNQICGGVIADAIGAGKTVVSIAMILQGLEKARFSRSPPRKSSATTLQKTTVKQILDADVVIVPIDIIESKGYLEELIKKSKSKGVGSYVPTLPQYSGQAEQTAARGLWIPHSALDPYAGGNNPRSQRRREDSAYYTFVYSKAILALRSQKFDQKETGVPVEYFEWERVIVDEIHESLCTTKVELERGNAAKEELGSTEFKERNRRAGREFLGITTKDIEKRPLVFRGSILGLTGTPLLDSSCRVTELASLMGGTYVTGLSSHWRKLEKESGRDIFLGNFLEPKQSREVRKMINERCQDYLNTACCRNKAEAEMDGIHLVECRRTVRMTEAEKQSYLASQKGIEKSKRSLNISVQDFDASNGADIVKLLEQNASLESRSNELLSICREILAKDSHTKIIVFADSSIGAVEAACASLQNDPMGCTWLDAGDSVQERNQKISFYQYADVTQEDHKRSRILVLSFEHAAGLNLQMESFNVVLFSPLYTGNGGGGIDDPVQDVSVELQAIGRVFRNGQTRPEVFVHRIEVLGPNGEECLDTELLRRNTDVETIAMATNADD